MLIDEFQEVFAADLFDIWHQALTDGNPINWNLIANRVYGAQLALNCIGLPHLADAIEILRKIAFYHFLMEMPEEVFHDLEEFPEVH